MRVRKVVKIDDREFVLRELTIAEIIDVFENTSVKIEDIGKDKASDTTDFLKDEIQRIVNLSLEGEHEVKDFYKMAPSELKLIYDGFKEANEVFFHIAAKMGLEGMLEGIKTSIQKDFSEVLALSSKAAMQRSLTTGTPTT